MNRYNPSDFSKEKSKDNIAANRNGKEGDKKWMETPIFKIVLPETKSTKQDTFQASEFVKYPIDNKEIESFLKFHNGRKKTYVFGGWPFLAKTAASSTATTKSTSTATELPPSRPL